MRWRVCLSAPEGTYLMGATTLEDMGLAVDLWTNG